MGPYSPGGPGLHLHLPTMSWDVYDYTAGLKFNYRATGDHFTSTYGHRYFVVLRAEDAIGIKQMHVGGSGIFEAFTADTKHVRPGATGSILSEEFNNTAAAAPYHVLPIHMVPDLGDGIWDYYELRCGRDGTSGDLLFASAGVMTFTGTATNTFDRSSSASLTTSP